MKLFISIAAALALLVTDSRAASTISFSNITLTNAVKTNDLLLVDSALGGTNYATRTATIATVKNALNIPSPLPGTVIASGTPAVGDLLSASDTSGTNGVWASPLWSTNYLSTNADVIAWIGGPMVRPSDAFPNVEIDGRWYGLWLENPDLVIDTFGDGSAFSDQTGGLSAPGSVGGLNVAGVQVDTDPNSAASGLQLLGFWCSTNPVPANKPVVVVNANHFFGRSIQPGEPLFGVVNDYSAVLALVVVPRAPFPIGFCRTGFNTNTPSSILEVTSYEPATDYQKWSDADGTLAASLSSNKVFKAVSGFSSTATDAAVSIASGGWTNSFGKNAQVSFDGTGVTFTVYNGAGTPVYTNAATVTHADVTLQPSGKVLITAGSGISGMAWPW